MAMTFKMVSCFSLPSTSGTTQPSELPGTAGSSSVHALQEICPGASLSDIESALAVCNGDAHEAVQQLLGNVFIVYFFTLSDQHNSTQKQELNVHK